jgi:hypothetical protein
VTSFAEIHEGLPRKIRLLHRHGFDDNSRPPEEHVALPAPFMTDLRFDDYRQVQKVSGAHQAGVGCVYSTGKLCGLGVPEEDGGKRGGV